jgi:hypothetical protein
MVGQLGCSTTTMLEKVKIMLFFFVSDMQTYPSLTSIKRGRGAVDLVLQINLRGLRAIHASTKKALGLSNGHAIKLVIVT